jgi:hypothetical protein
MSKVCTTFDISTGTGMRHLAACLLACSAFVLSVTGAWAQDPTPTRAATPPAAPPRPTRTATPLPGGGMLPAWMTPPASGPSQAEQGAVIYYYLCMACHGDRLQGLTVEWRAQWPAGHQDCSVGACHGARHPPEGFTFPKNYAPPLVGQGALARYQTAQELFEFITARMPYQSPGSLTPHEAWQLVAFILRERGVRTAALDETTAAQIPIRAPPPAAAPQPLRAPPTPASQLVPALVAAAPLLLPALGVLALALILVLAARISSKR